MIYPRAVISERTKVEAHERSHIGDFCFVSVPYLKMEEGSHINAGAKLIGQGKVYLGEYSVVSYDAKLMTSSDSPVGMMSDYSPLRLRYIKTGDITIGRHCFIGANAIIMPGVTIGDKSVVYAGCYVDKDIPPDVLVKPAKRGIYIDARHVEVEELRPPERKRILKMSEEEE